MTFLAISVCSQDFAPERAVPNQQQLDVCSTFWVGQPHAVLPSVFQLPGSSAASFRAMPAGSARNADTLLERSGSEEEILEAIRITCN
jgi:hypothetical protein